MQTHSPNKTLSISNNQLHILAIYSDHQAEYRTISKKKKTIIQCNKDEILIFHQSGVMWNYIIHGKNVEFSGFCTIM